MLPRCLLTVVCFIGVTSVLFLPTYRSLSPSRIWPRAELEYHAFNLILHAFTRNLLSWIFAILGDVSLMVISLVEDTYPIASVNCPANAVLYSLA